LNRPFSPGTPAAAAAIFLAILLLTPASDAAAQTPDGGDASNRLEGRRKLLPIPYVNYDRSIGLQGGFLPVMMFNPVESDTISPSSMAGLFGMYTTNETWFAAAFTKVFLDEDNWRIVTAAGTGDYNFQFFVDYPLSIWIPYNSEIGFFTAQVQRRVYNKLYLGMSYVLLDFRTTLEPIPEYSQSKTMNGLGVSLEMDRRGSFYYPRSGFLSRLKYFTFPEAFGNGSGTNKIDFEYNHYLPFRGDRDVFAGRFFAGIGLGNLAFQQQYIVGQMKDIRGYTQGKYRGDYLLALQGEYRWNFYKRWGAVGFAGVAAVFESINEDDDGKLLPAVGTGFRFVADRDTHMTVGMDIAVGLDDWGMYFRLGEAF
jgi:hypothetical protein